MSNNLVIEPYNPTPVWMIWKFWIGLIIWLMIAFFIFILLMVFWGLFDEAIRSTMWGNASANPVLSLIIMIIAFLAAFLWNVMVWIIYNLFFNNKYYDLGKTLSLVSIINIFLFFIMALIYVVYNSNAEVLFLVLAFHIFFAVFLSITIMEIATNPNYSWVHMIWATIWLIISILIFLIVYNTLNIGIWDWIEMLFILPPLLSYTIVPLLHSLWEKLYYKFYEAGNNFLYIPSIDEVLVNEEDEDDVNVENL